jgi:hypothetical protein
MRSFPHLKWEVGKEEVNRLVGMPFKIMEVVVIVITIDNIMEVVIINIRVRKEVVIMHFQVSLTYYQERLHFLAFRFLV